jgi:hypothetical protein
LVVAVAMVLLVLAILWGAIRVAKKRGWPHVPIVVVLSLTIGVALELGAHWYRHVKRTRPSAGSAIPSRSNAR